VFAELPLGLPRPCSAVFGVTLLQRGLVSQVLAATLFVEAFWPTALMELPLAALTPGHKRYQRVMEGFGGAVGAGSFGRVYLAIDRITNIHVAVKRHNKLPNPEAGREFTIYALLMNYPCLHVMALTDYFLDHDILYTVHELCGTDLWRYFQQPLVQRGHFEEFVVKGYLHGVCSGVGHLHGLAITHGDLSLKNILVNRNGIVKIADYGAAHSAHGYVVSADHEITTTYVRAHRHIIECTFLFESTYDLSVLFGRGNHWLYQAVSWLCVSIVLSSRRLSASQVLRSPPLQSIFGQSALSPWLCRQVKFLGWEKQTISCRLIILVSSAPSASRLGLDMRSCRSGLRIAKCLARLWPRRGRTQIPSWIVWSSCRTWALCLVITRACN